MMQAASDIFLGWLHDPEEGDAVARDYYVRQLWDWKTSVNLEAVSPYGLELYGKACGWTLAGRTHGPATESRSPLTWARATSSTVPSPTSPLPMQI